jgi:hypothetical protein
MTGLHHVRILIPMLGRAHLVQWLVENIRTSSDASVLFICSPNDRDAIIACNRSGEDVLVVDWEPERADYAKKINLGYRETIEPWLFLGASDLVFHHDWDKFGLMVAERTGAGVVGTQDTRNPSVKRGIQSTHSLVRREYIQEFGGTYDHSGEIYSEHYDHQYVDVELVETAKLRGRWAFSKRSVVEHRHPHWGTAENDATYEKAMRQTTQDRRLYVRRIRRAQTVHARNVRRAAL